MMKKIHSLPILCCVLFLIIGVTSYSHAMEVLVFSPLRYTVGTAGTSAFTETVTMGNVLSGEFHLIVQNGSEGENKVDLVEVYIDGKRVIKLTSKKDLIDKKVKLLQDSEMRIQLTGPQNSFVVVSIIVKKLTQVPLVIRMAQADASTDLTASLLRVKRKPLFASHGYIPTGSVISQTPKAGVYVKEKSKASITVSTGPAQIITLLPGEPTALASGAIVDYDIDDKVTPSEIETVTPDVEVARTKLLIAFQPDATIGDINSLLTSIGGHITAMLEGVNQIIVRIPDPGSLSALDTLVNTYLTGNPIVRYVEKATMPVMASLPPPLNPTHVFFGNITHQLDVRAHAAWNARSLISKRVSPHIIMADGFGDGPPNADFAVNPLNIGDFKTGDLDPDSHGYMVLGVMAATYGGDDVRGSVTGTYPGSSSSLLTLSVVDAQWGYTSLDIRLKLMEFLELLRTNHRVGVILNTSLGHLCPSGNYLDKTCIEPGALAWLEQVRGATLWPTGLTGPGSLENWFLHITAAGNVLAQGDTDAVFNSEWTAARLLTGLVVPETGSPLMNLTNTLVIESRDRSPVLLGGTPGCLASDSKFPGNLSAIGQDIFSLAGSSLDCGIHSGTSYATPQVAGLAAYMWTIKPGLTPQQIMDILIRTADTSSCGGFQSAPVIDAYAAVLALDRNYPDMEVRRAIFDLNVNGYFDEQDVEQFLNEFDTANGAKDYSRYDLNGNGMTGGDATNKFNLDMDYPPTYTTVSQNIEGNGVSSNESFLTDQQILCYYAYSPLYTGSDTKRKDLLGDKCTQRPKHGLKLIVGSPLINGQPVSVQFGVWAYVADQTSCYENDGNWEVDPCSWGADCLFPPFAYNGCTVTGGGFLTIGAGTSVTYDAAAYLNAGAFSSMTITNSADGTELIISMLGSTVANPSVFDCDFNDFSSDGLAQLYVHAPVLDITNSRDHYVGLFITWDFTGNVSGYDPNGASASLNHYGTFNDSSYPCPYGSPSGIWNELFHALCYSYSGCTGPLSGTKYLANIAPGEHVQRSLVLSSEARSLALGGCPTGGCPPLGTPTASFSGKVTLRLEDY